MLSDDEWVKRGGFALMAGLAGVFILKIVGQESAKRAEREAAAEAAEDKDTVESKVEFRPLGETDD